MMPRYTALPILAMILKIFGWLVIIAGAVAAFAMVISSPADATLRTALARAFWRLLESLVRGTLVLAVAEGIHVLLDIEENTRRTAEAAAGERIQPTPEN
jgi:uncharacterized ion transporter superfamily protein YfcC